jgi:hypothetical protein
MILPGLVEQAKKNPKRDHHIIIQNAIGTLFLFKNVHMLLGDNRTIFRHGPFYMLH